MTGRPAAWQLARVSGPLRWSAVAAAALLATSAGLAGCRTQAPVDAPAGATASVPQADALETLTAVAPGAATPAAGGAEAVVPNTPDTGGTLSPEQQTAVAQRATDEAAAGIADVGALVQSMPPLATFTPAPGGARVSGRLVYVRSGGVYVAEAGAGPGTKLADDLPSVWSPPEDPGRAWQTADGRRLVFFAGGDAELWTVGTDGSDARPISGPNLPVDEFDVAAWGRTQSLRLRPGMDYTLVAVPDGEQPFFAFTDDNSRHIRGEARLRVVHAARAQRDTVLRVSRGAEALGGPVAYGQSTGDQRVLAGEVALSLADETGRPVAGLPAFDAGDHELRTVFLYGADELRAAQFAYEPSEPPSGSARVRVFNAGDEPLDVTIGAVSLAEGLAAGELGRYAEVRSLLGTDARHDAEISLYGLRQGEQPLALDPTGERVAFVGFGDGRPDLYVAELGGEARRVTEGESREYNPVWSRDGRTLAWLAVDEAQDRTSLGVLPARATAPTTVDLTPILTTLSWRASVPIRFPKAPDWTSDGRLAVYPQSESTSGGIWLYDPAAGTLEQVYAAAIEQVDYSAVAERWAVGPADRPGTLVTVDHEGREAPLASGDAYAPKWSPDGRLVSWVEGDSMRSEGWRLHVVRADGTGDVAVTGPLPLLQAEPPVPGPRAKRAFIDDRIAFTRAGRDYGAAERSGQFGAGQAGDDIENLWLVPVAGGEPTQATDLTRVFYMRDPVLSPDGRTLGLVAFSYLDRSSQLWVLPAEGGKPVKVDGGVRWFGWAR